MGVQATFRRANCDIVINMVAESRTPKIRGGLCLFLKKLSINTSKLDSVNVLGNSIFISVGFD